jgi:hypothetical protein
MQFAMTLVDYMKLATLTIRSGTPTIRSPLIRGDRHSLINREGDQTLFDALASQHRDNWPDSLDSPSRDPKRCDHPQRRRCRKAEERRDNAQRARDQEHTQHRVLMRSGIEAIPITATLAQNTIH